MCFFSLKDQVLVAVLKSWSPVIGNSTFNVLFTSAIASFDTSPISTEGRIDWWNVVKSKEEFWIINYVRQNNIFEPILQSQSHNHQLILSFRIVNLNILTKHIDIKVLANINTIRESELAGNFSVLGKVGRVSWLNGGEAELVCNGSWI